MAFPTVTVEFGFSSDPTVDYLVLDDPDRGLLNTGRLGPSDGLWTDVSAYVRGVKIDRGRQWLLENYRTGTCTLELDNADGRFSPHSLSGPYVSAGVTQLQPERRVRVQATWGGTTYDLFHGFVDSWAPEWGHPQGGSTIVRASDGLKVLARFDPLAESSPVGSGERTDQRISRLLDLASWPDGDRALSTGNSTVQASTLAQNVLTEILLTTDSEGVTAAFYMDEAGKATFEHRNEIFEATRSNTVQAVFGDEPGEVPYFSLGIPPFDATVTKNDVSIARVGGTAQTAEDTDSIARYFHRTHRRHDLIFETDAEAASYADALIYFASYVEQRIDTVALRGLPDDTDRAVWPEILGRRLRDRIQVIRRPDNDAELDLELYIEGVKHEIQPGNRWVCEFSTSSATQPADPGFLVLDHATLGKLDTGGVLAHY